MQCPKCQRENFETDKPCPQCGFEGDAQSALRPPSLTPKEAEKPGLPQTDIFRLKTASFLLDNVDLLPSRNWFKSKKEIEKVVGCIMAMMADALSDNESE